MKTRIHNKLNTQYVPVYDNKHMYQQPEVSKQQPRFIDQVDGSIIIELTKHNPRKT